MQDPEQRISGKMGKAGSADVEYSTDSARTPGKLPSWHRLGAVYRCSHPCRGCTGSSDCISALGTSGADEEKYVA